LLMMADWRLVLCYGSRGRVLDLAVSEGWPGVESYIHRLKLFKRQRE